MNNLGIKEIAKLAGVSIGTVDRVLHNRSGVSQKTKEKVQKIIDDTGYEKNVIASRLKLAAVKKIKIAVVFPEIKYSKSYWNLHQKGIQRAIKELKGQGISVKHFYFQISKPKTFTNIFEQILSDTFQAIISVPFLEAECNQLLKRAKKKKIPVVFLDTETDLKYPTNFIRQNSFNAGMVAGRLLYGLVGEKADFVVVNILTKRGIQANNQQREIGFRHFFKENFPNQPIKIHQINQPLDKDIEFSKEIQQNLYTATRKGIFVTNSRSYLLPPILKRLKIRNAYIIGFDVSKKNLAYLNSGAIHFLLHQQPQYQGYMAIKELYKYLTQQADAQLTIDIPVEIIVKENVGSLKELTWN